MGIQYLHGDWSERYGVSIQLVSPASGDGYCNYGWFTDNANVSIQLVSPASGDHPAIAKVDAHKRKVSIQLVSPASGDKGTQGAIAGVPLLIYSPLFLFVCRSCHQWIHAHPIESYKNHWMIHRNRPMAEDWMNNDKVLLNRKSQF